MNHTFADDVIKGLSSTPKTLSSKYFYNERGDKLFQEIMGMEEYYLTRCEYEVLTMKKNELLQFFMEGHSSFQLIELGAGDGLKTKVLLKYFLEKEADFTYFPIDISSNALEKLSHDLWKTFPDLKVEGQQGEYFEALSKLKHDKSTRNVVLFLGSNIGNFLESQAISFLSKLSETLMKDDLILIGFDLKKDPSVILEAYNDKHGITRAFNLNLLERINEELGGNFDISKFKHFPIYDPLTGETKSYLVSREEQTVTIDKVNSSFQFDAWEVIHTEISQKYDLRAVENLAEKSGFSIIKNLYDCKHYYLDSIWKVD